MANNVLIVDDSVIIRKMVARNLDMADIELGEVHFAENGQEALEKLEQHWIDVVLADINMPVMNGEEFVEAIRQRPEFADVLIVIVSTEANRQRLDRLVELGVSESLHKPFEPEALAEIIGRCLGVGS